MSQFKYFDNQYIRSISSQNFNFALDKESNVSICWGKQENEDPEYDPISPQQITFEINEKTNIYNLINVFNKIANIKEQKKINEQYITINQISNQNQLNDLLKSINLKILSTTTYIILNIKNKIDKDLCSIFIKYLNKFNVKTLIQINNALTKEDIKELKFLSSDIILKYDKQTVQTYNLLKNELFKIDLKIYVNNDNFKQIINNLSNINSDTRGIIYLIDPLIDNINLIELEGRIINLKLKNIYLNACNLNKFNKDNKNFKHTIQISNCDSCTYSCYIKNQKIYPCQFITKSVSNKDQNNIWFSNKIIKFRNQIIQKTYCQS